jgi:hypothetical protein
MKKPLLIATLVVIAVAFATIAHSQTLEQQQRRNQIDRTINKLDQLKTLADSMEQERKFQCMAAVANKAFCECLGENLPVVLDFTNYVVIVTRTKVELKYSTLSADDKSVIDNTYKIRDQCVKLNSR